MTTIGDLTAHDIGHTRVRVEFDGTIIEGVLHELRLEVVRAQGKTLVGDETFPHGAVIKVYVTPTIGTFTIERLDRGRACEVIA